MKQCLLYFLLLLGLAAPNAEAVNNCNADTTFFYLPQNEFNSGNSWYKPPRTDQEQWNGGFDIYEMYDACIAKENTIVITEVNSAAGNNGTYLELTNIGDQPVDLSDYRLISQRNEKDYPNLKISRMAHADLSGMLNPGACYIIMGYSKYKNVSKGVMDRSDSLSRHNDKLAEIADLKYAIDKTSEYPFVVGRTYDILGSNHEYNYTLAKVIGDSIEVVVDVFEQLFVDGGKATIAGVPTAANNFTIVRKQFTNGRTYGNADFIIGAGSEAAEASEWMVVPRFRNGTTHLPTTIGHHNPNSEFSLSPKVGSGITINAANDIITLPWGVYRGDSIMAYLNVGDDMTWEYKTNGVAEEEQSVIAHNGDSITFYHCGIDVTVKTFRIEVANAQDNMAMAFCKYRKGTTAKIYNESVGLGIDTIYSNRLYFDYPVDTLLAYVEIAKNATREIIWKDGDNKRPTLKNGDVLQVTAKDGTQHSYYIALVPYDQGILSHDAGLNTISWPDYPVDDLDPYLWTTGDTIPGFNQGAYTYLINLPAGTSRIPALKAYPSSSRASVKSFPATNLFGTETDQTYRFVVTAEDDTTLQEYSVRFIVETEDWEFDAAPFISEISRNSSRNVNIEVCNPGNTLIDLSDYVIVHSKYAQKTLASTFEWDNDSFWDNCKVYRPGYVYDSLTMATNKAIWYDPNGDSDVDPLLEPGAVYTIASQDGTSGSFDLNTGGFSGTGNGIIERPNVLLHSKNSTANWSYNKHGSNAYGMVGRTIYAKGTSTNQCNTFWLLKIVNDSIKFGTKGVTDPTDFDIIDVVGKIEDGQTIGWMNPATGEPYYPNPKGGYIRKPEFYVGNPNSMGSFGYDGIETTSSYDENNPILGDSTALEWNYFSTSPYNFDFGRHTFNPITIYKSTIKSTTYLITNGLSMQEQLYGVLPNTTGADLFSNLIKTHQGQTLALTTSNGSLIFNFDILNEGDILTVTSADGNNTTAYIIHVGALTSDLSLRSDVYTVEDGKVTLTNAELTLKEIAENLSVATTAQFYIVNSDDELVTYTAFDFRDSIYYDKVISNGLSVKVIDQTGTSRLYAIKLPTLNSDVFITSDYFKIDNASKEINGVSGGTNVARLLNQIVACDGATVEVLNKWGQSKNFGIVLFNDVVKITAADNTTTAIYGITLNSEIEPEIALLNKEKRRASGAIAFPNPTQGGVTFTNTFVKAQVFDITGKLVKTVEKKGAKIDLSTLNNGVYMITVLDISNKTTTVKLIKQ